MRAPPESFRPTTGAPIFMARSMIFTILAALVSDREPPNTVKSCAKAYTGRPSMRPWPATTPSPGTSCRSMPKSRQRCVTSLSISSKLPGSNSASTRSRAVSLPCSCCRARRASPPPSSACRSSAASLSWGSIRPYLPCDLFQSARNFSSPMPVSGWLNRESMTFVGHVQTSAPSRAASTTWIGWRTEATSTSVPNS